MEQKSKSLLAIFQAAKSTSSNAIFYDYKQTICDVLWTLFEKGYDPQWNQLFEKTPQWLHQWIYHQIILINTYFIQSRKLYFILIIIYWPWITNMLFKINSWLICCTVEYWIRHEAVFRPNYIWFYHCWWHIQQPESLFITAWLCWLHRCRRQNVLATVLVAFVTNILYLLTLVSGTNNQKMSPISKFCH